MNRISFLNRGYAFKGLLAVFITFSLYVLVVRIVKIVCYIFCRKIVVLICELFKTE